MFKSWFSFRINYLPSYRILVFCWHNVWKLINKLSLLNTRDILKTASAWSRCGYFFPFLFLILCVLLFITHFLFICILSFIFSVILSNYYDLPFNDILDWKKFALVLKEIDVYRLKQILKAITNEEFVSLHQNLVKVMYILMNDQGR